MAPFLTVVTPTYNRAATLSRVYDSLCRQTFTDFEWIVVDDGSTDDTAELVAGWAAKARFPLRYIRQDNAHKKTAFNTGVRVARGEMLVCADSDDAIPPDAFHAFHEAWLGIPPAERAGFAGVRGHCGDEAGRRIGHAFPAGQVTCDYAGYTYGLGAGQEKWSCDRTDLLKAHPFPEDIGGHVPEGIVWSAIYRGRRIRLIDAIVRIYHDSSDSLTRTRSLVSLRANAEGSVCWAADVLGHDMRYLARRPSHFLRLATGYTRFGRHMRAAGRTRRYPIRSLAGRLLVLAAMPLGLILYRRDLRQGA